jgi:pseudouridine synthase
MNFNSTQRVTPARTASSPQLTALGLPLRLPSATAFLMKGAAMARATVFASRLGLALGRRASDGKPGVPSKLSSSSPRRPSTQWASHVPWVSQPTRVGTVMSLRGVSVSASSSSSETGGGGFLPDAPREVPPPTPKRVGPRQIKKRFTGEDSLTPKELKLKGEEGMRLSKALAQLGIASRRGSEEIIFAGRVSVNGVTIETPQYLVNQKNDVISVDGKVLDGGLGTDNTHVYFMLNKPKGYLCSNKGSSTVSHGTSTKFTSSQTGGDKLVMDLFDDYKSSWRKKHPGKLPPRLFTVGRLDVNTTGLLLVTTDGQWCQRVAHPSSSIVKSYVVTANARPTKLQIKDMAGGTVVDGKKVVPSKVESLENARDGGPANRIVVEVIDGRNKEVRTICASAGVGVKKLKRVRVGGLRMPSELPIGKYLTLKPHQVGYVLDKGLMFNEQAGEARGQMGKTF